MKLLIASNNAGKVREIKAILGPFYPEIYTPRDIGLDLDVVEDGQTFEDNARLKARAFAQASGMDALADDSGLCVDALNGQTIRWGSCSPVLYWQFSNKLRSEFCGR